MITSIANVMPVSADDAVSPYPYTFFAGSNEDGAITSTAGNFCINGNAATNGTFAVAGNFNVNGAKTEHAGENIPIIFDEIDEHFFSGDVEKHSEDYSYSELNINVTVPIEVQGELELDGNITLNTGLKALGDITLTGEVKNTNDSVICSQTGDIFIDSQNVNLGGLVYAPCGTVTLKAQNLNLNNVIIIADKISIDAPSVNANYSTSMGQLVGEAISANNNGSTNGNGGHNADDTIDLMIYAFGSYNKEEKAVDIEWYSNIKGRYEISESADNDIYVPLAEVTDFTTYRYHITNDFDNKYFKIKVTKEDKSAESVPFVVSRTDDGYRVDFLDSDSDGLADIYENIIGTDVNNSDTDDDGLTDHTEVYMTGTDPTKYDSVTEGVSDFDADNDNDGLSNGTEIELGTDPMNSDTDGDELSDGEEINTYGTDPLNTDTDGDTLPDGDEPYIGLDPANPETFGTPDGEYISEQTIAADSEALSEINTDENPYELTIKYTGTGYAEGNISAGESGYANTVGSDMELGTIAEFSFKDSCKMDKAVLYYKVKSEFTDNELGTYAADNDELSGIKRLGVFAFNEEHNILVPVVTEYDIENNTVYAEVDAQGTYFLVDYEKWLKEWGVSAKKNTKALRFMSAAANVRSTYATKEKIEKADIVFSINTAKITSNILGESATANLEREKNYIHDLCDRVFENGEDIKIAILGYSNYPSNYPLELCTHTYVSGNNEWASDISEVDTLLSQISVDTSNQYGCLEFAMQDVANPIYGSGQPYTFRDGSVRYCFIVTPTSNVYNWLNIYSVDIATLCSVSASLSFMKIKNIYTSFIFDKYVVADVTNLANQFTDGTVATYTSDSGLDETYDFIYETATKEKKEESRTYVSSLNLQNIVLDEPLDSGSDTNTDTDGFTDWEEVDSDNDLITYEFGDVHLPTYEECLSACDGTYMDLDKVMNVMKNKLGIVIEMQLFGKEILPLDSDPTNEDTDGDRLKDNLDAKPRKRFSKEFLLSDNYDMDIMDVCPSSYINFYNDCLKSFNSIPFDSLESITKERLKNAYGATFMSHFMKIGGSTPFAEFIIQLFEGGENAKLTFGSFPDAVKALNKYMEATGGIYEYENYYTSILTTKSQKKAYCSRMNKLLKVAESTVTLGDKLTFVTNPKNEWGITFDSINDNPFEPNWYYTIGTGKNAIVSTVSSYYENGLQKYKADVKFYIFDVYDFFDKNNPTEDFAFLHLCGWAKCFLGYGVYQTSITWNKGDRFPSEDDVRLGKDFGTIVDKDNIELMIFDILGKYPTNFGTWSTLIDE